MKFLLTIGAALCLAVSARAGTTPTNAVKVSELSVASTPLTGSELVPIVQSGATKQTTVTAINAAAFTATTAASNVLYALTLTNGAALTLASNLVWQIVYTNATAATAASNLLYKICSTNSTASTAASNALYSLTVSTSATTGATVSNAALSQLQGTNAALVSQINSVAAGLGGSVTNGGTVTLSGAAIGNLTTPSVSIGSMTVGSHGTLTTNLSLSAATCQRVTFTADAASTLVFTPTNCVDGQNVWLFVYLPLGGYVSTASTVPGFNCVNFSTAPFQSTGSKHIVVVNYQVIGTNILWGAQVSQ